jgi:hypothetical protein
LLAFSQQDGYIVQATIAQTTVIDPTKRHVAPASFLYRPARFGPEWGRRGDPDIKGWAEPLAASCVLGAVVWMGEAA